MTAPAQWLALAATIFIEALIVAAIAARHELGVRRLAVLSVVLNLITQPLLSVWLRVVLVGQNYLYLRHLAVGELVVWVFEAAAYAWLLRAQPRRIACGLALAGAANGASLAIGFALPL